MYSCREGIITNIKDLRISSKLKPANIRNLKNACLLIKSILH